MESEKQIKIWENRVFYPDIEFKKNTLADLEKLNKIINQSKESMVIVSSSSESCVYKIGKHMIKRGINNNVLTFQDGEIFSVYVDTEAKHNYEIRKLCDSLIDIIGNLKNKWLVIPRLDCKWSKDFAIAFIFKLKQADLSGLLFYSNPDYPDTLAQVLCEDTQVNVFQFPKEVYKKRTRKIVNDEF